MFVPINPFRLCLPNAFGPTGAASLIVFHELKESSIVIELAMCKSRIDGTTPVRREDCRVAIPDPAKKLVMEYCGFMGFLEPVIEGA